MSSFLYLTAIPALMTLAAAYGVYRWTMNHR